MKRIIVMFGCFFALSCAVIAQDVIITKDSKRIDAKVTEVNLEDIKYKNFDNTDGPTYTLLKSNIVSILYQNGQVETFGAETPAVQAAVPVSAQAQTETKKEQPTPPTSKIVTTEKNEVSGSGVIVELGTGSISVSVKADGHSTTMKGDGVSVDFGLGYRKAFTPYIAWDIFKLRAFTQVNSLKESLTPQILSSVRGTSPVLFANAKAYAGFGLGYGYTIDAEQGGLCYELQIGIDITPKSYIGFIYSGQTYSINDDDYKYSMNLMFTGLRVGFKF